MVKAPPIRFAEAAPTKAPVCLGWWPGMTPQVAPATHWRHALARYLAKASHRHGARDFSDICLCRARTYHNSNDRRSPAVAVDSRRGNMAPPTANPLRAEGCGIPRVVDHVGSVSSTCPSSAACQVNPSRVLTPTYRRGKRRTCNRGQPFPLLARWPPGPVRSRAQLSLRF